MYLIGLLGDRDYYDFDVEFKIEVTREDLLKAKKDDSFQVIDVLNKKYFDAESNEWKKIKSSGK